MGIKISNLPTATESQTTDIVPIVQDGTTKKIQQSILFKNLNDGMADLNNEMTDLDSRLEEAIAEFSTPLKYKGQVQTFNDLPVNADNGDIYSVVSENKNYVWNGTEWIEYSQTINIDDEIKTTLTTQEASETEITNIAGVNGKIDITDGNSVQNLLPEEYQEVEYIEFTGTQYIDTGIKPTNTIGCYAKAKPSSGIGDRILTGSSDGNRFYIYLPTGTETKFAVGWNTNIIYDYVIDYTTNYEILLNYKNNRKVTINGNDLATNLEQFTGNNKNIYIGCANGSSGATAFYKGTLNVLQITNNNEIIRNFIPCYRKTDNVIGMYDTVSNTFFTNAGTGTFEKGNDVSGDYLLSPTYPIPIRNVGDNINLLSGDTSYSNSSTDTMTQINFNIWGGDNSEAQITRFIRDAIVKTTGKYSFTFSTTQNYTKIRIQHSGASTNLNKTFDINLEANKTYTLSLNITGTNPSVLGGFTYNKVKIQEGAVSNPVYSSYNCGNANIKVQNKNLFNKNGEIITGYYLNASGQPVSAQGAWYTNYYISVKSNTAYTSSGGDVANRVCFYDENKNFISRTNQEATTFTYTTPANCKYIRISNNNDYSNVQVEEGSATSYVPHQSQLITFPFTEGQRMYLGDYLASNGIHHTKGQIVFDGSSDESWETATNPRRFYIPVTIDYLKSNGNITYMSNYFKAVGQTTSGGSVSEDNVINFDSSAVKYVRVYMSSKTTVADFKTWLSTHNLIVEYELAEEEIEPFTPEQEEAYWQLQHCLMYEGYTKIECIDEIKCKFKVEYSYNNELNTTYQGKIDEINEDIHNLDNKVDENVNRIENEINTLHSYSTSEQVVGTWVTGKPLYRKVIAQSFTPTFDTGMLWSKYTLSTPISNVGVITNCIFVGNEECAPVQVHKASSTWEFYTNQNYSYTHIIVEYTKTTD